MMHRLLYFSKFKRVPVENLFPICSPKNFLKSKTTIIFYVDKLGNISNKINNTEINKVNPPLLLPSFYQETKNFYLPLPENVYIPLTCLEKYHYFNYHKEIEKRCIDHYLNLFYHVTIPLQQFSGLLSISPELDKLLKIPFDNMEGKQIHNYLVTLFCQLLHCFRHKIDSLEQLLIKLYPFFNAIDYPTPKSIEKLLAGKSMMAVKQHILVLVFNYIKIPITVLKNITDNLLDYSSYGKEGTTLNFVEDYICLTNIKKELIKNRNVKGYAINHENTEVIPDYDEKFALISCGQKNPDYLFQVPYYSIMDNIIKLSQRYLDSKSYGISHSFTKSQVSLMRFNILSFKETCNIINAYKTDLQKYIKNNLNNLSFEEQQHFIDFLSKITTFLINTKYNNYIGRLELFFETLILPNIFETNMKNINISICGDIKIDVEFKELVEKHLYYAIKENLFKLLNSNAIFPPKNHIPIENRELIADMLHGLTSLFPEEMQQEIHENITKLQIGYTQEKL